ncbi:MAG: TPM domain-containing protein, partial [Chakrabartia sp.]
MMAFMRPLLLMLALLVTTLPAHAQTFPALSGRVVDTANIIPDADEAALDAKLKALEETTDRQMVVATIPDLGGYAIDDYGYRLGRNWGLGQKDKDNGAILLVAVNDRKMRIEVGYGLEPILTDGLSSVIINTQIVPQFKAGDFAGGINAGVDAMIAQLKLPPEEAAKRAKQVSAKQSKEGDASAVMF